MQRSNWAYGVTTCAERVDTLLPATLLSLHRAGFTKPTIFADGVADPIRLQMNLSTRSPALVDLEVVARGRTPVKTFGNWVMGLWELLIRNPKCDRFAMFQDDLVMSLCVREYLDRIVWPTKVYLNLYTFPLNQAVAAPSAGSSLAGRAGWGFFEGKLCANGPEYHGRLGNKGLGAVALCFTRDAVVDLLSSRHVVTRPMDACWPTGKLDGCIVTALNTAGWREYCHDPSLVQHIGEQSSMGNKRHPSATSFKGENWSAMEML